MAGRRRRARLLIVAPALLALALAAPGCDGGAGDGPRADPDAAADAASADTPDAASADTLDAGADAERDAEPDAADDAAGSVPFVVVTFNSGTTETMGAASADDRYTEDHAAASDAWYGDGLAWLPAVEATRAFFAEVRPAVVAFQEIFFSAECADVPADARADFVCETWQPGDPTVAQVVLGAGYQVMCHPGKPDKCVAVRRDFGAFRGCDADLCPEGVVGFRVEDCGRGVRVGRSVIDRGDGSALTLVSVHGSSGLTADDMACRVAQFEQVFVDLGDGEPGANGAVNLVMGDLNTDPARLAIADPSARRWNDFVGADRQFHHITAVGEDVPTTYGAFGNIDHVASDALEGDCWAAGVTEGHPRVIEDRYFDHTPIVCTVTLP